MKKVLLIVTVLFVLTSLCSCAENKPDVKTSKPKADKSDYQKYVSDYNKGYPVSFCGMKPDDKKE